MWKLSATVAALAMAATAAHAASCSDEVEQFAAQHNLQAELPRAEAPAGTTAERPATTESRGVPPAALSRSGGVIAPPNQGRTVTIEPPRTNDAMPTAPELRPHTAERPSQDQAATEAATRTQVQSLVVSARAAAREGNEAACRERLEQARAIGKTG